MIREIERDRMKLYIDVSNLTKVDFITGIQRVVREIVIRMLDNKELELYLIVYSYQNDGFQLIDNQKFYDYFVSSYKENNNCEDEKKQNDGFLTARFIYYNEIPTGAIFFDIDSVWNSRLKRSYLFPILKQKGVKIVTLIYDIIPITHPQFCYENTTMNFMLYLGANLQYADLIITSANATCEAVNKITDQLGIKRKSMVAIPLGSDFAKKGSSFVQEKGIDPNIRKLAKETYILMVGTIEPRKNHSLVLDALEDGLSELGIKVVFAGRIGWNMEEFERRIRNHKWLNQKLFFIRKPDDATIDYLYKNAFLVAFPTFNEGFGLPVIEAFERGTPVIASDIEVLHEVAGEYADYFDPYDKEDFIRCVKELFDQPEQYQKRKERLKEFVPISWDFTAKEITDAILEIGRRKERIPENIEIKQVVVLTARNQDILATLPYIERFMPFITEMLICCPDKNVSELKRSYQGRIQLKFLTDSELLKGDPLPEDHSTRNFFLRSRILKNPFVDDVFLMTDDDYRPLKTLTKEHFIQDGKYLAYYCYDLQKWQGTYGSPTSFDISMQKSKQFLQSHCYPTMMYASHQMQVIDKKIFCQLLEEYPAIVKQGLCEWTTYFNYGIYHYPDLFQPVPYVSMGWPGSKSDWDLYIQPKEYLFENYYDSLYKESGLFEGFSKNYHSKIEEENIQKVVRYSREIQEQVEAREVYRSYCESYWLQYREIPSFVVLCGINNNIVIHTPIYLQLKNSCWTRVPLVIDSEIVDWLGARRIVVSYWFSSEENENLTGAACVEIDIKQLKFDLPVKAPDRKEKGFFNFKVVLEDQDMMETVKIGMNII